MEHQEKIKDRALRYNAKKNTWHHLHPEVLARLFGEDVLKQPMVKWFYEGERIELSRVQASVMTQPELFRVLDYGSRKYASLNYTKGMRYSEVFDSWFRHRYEYTGEHDGESGLEHFAHCLCNELFAFTYEVLGYDGGEFDDRPIVKSLTEGEKV